MNMNKVATIGMLLFTSCLIAFTLFSWHIGAFGQDQEEEQKEIQLITKYPPYNENVTRILQLQIDFNEKDFNLEELIQDGYYVTLKIKSDRYTDFMKTSLYDLVLKDHRVLVPIINNASNTDDGGDFRIDVWVNQYDNRFLKATYPISRNATFDQVDINNLIKYVVKDNLKEEDDEEGYEDEQHS